MPLIITSEDDSHYVLQSEVSHNASSIRRRIFGKSHESSPKSKDSPVSSPTVRDSDKESMKTDELVKGSPRDSSSLRSRHKPKKNSLDGGKAGDRLSIFGGSFSGTLGKHRKPPPTYEFTVFHFDAMT